MCVHCLLSSSSASSPPDISFAIRSTLPAQALAPEALSSPARQGSEVQQPISPRRAAPAQPSHLDESITPLSQCSVSEYLFQMLDMQVHFHLSQDAVEGFMKIYHPLSPAGARLPASYSELRRWIDSVTEDKSLRFYPICSRACGPGDASKPTCGVCGEKLFNEAGRAKQVMFLRSPDDWANALRENPALQKTLTTYLLTASARGEYSDVQDGSVMKRLMTPGAPPLHRPREGGQLYGMCVCVRVCVENTLY